MPEMVLDTTHSLQQGSQWPVWGLHQGPPINQLKFSYASGYLWCKTNSGNPGKLETDEKSGQRLTARNYSARNSSPKQTCSSSLIVFVGEGV